MYQAILVNGKVEKEIKSRRKDEDKIAFDEIGETYFLSFENRMFLAYGNPLYLYPESVYASIQKINKDGRYIKLTYIPDYIARNKIKETNS